MLPLGSLLLIGFGLLVAVTVRRWASDVRTATLAVAGIASVPAALLGIVIMGFSTSAEATRNGAVFLALGVIAGCSITAAFVVRLTRS
ncbi:hypothetical protein [uncultured Bradyrhizobium sp.]|uniref:hypothetical protein n=1 Tax=uncultured Bradyrhizobium sp. TaxID=199684 RepID=UPI0035C9E84D